MDIGFQVAVTTEADGQKVCSLAGTAGAYRVSESAFSAIGAYGAVVLRLQCREPGGGPTCNVHIMSGGTAGIARRYLNLKVLGGLNPAR